jgi:16S rRNA C967 or C1407 C5-methylase (RsmB/RsmF family)/NOL1/NOP2/fmu family ribosome biogenesis protein
VNLPEAFMASVRAMYPMHESEQFLQAILKQPKTSVRINPRVKIESPMNMDLEKNIPWSQTGKTLTNRPSFVADPLFHAGAYYVQESSSMFVDYLFEQIKLELPQPKKILDLCASPGGKSLGILSLCTDDDLFVANEISPARATVLHHNIIKWGRSQTIVTNNKPADFNKLTNYFDVILVDAPCSGEGMFRKDEDARKEWSEKNVNACAVRQQYILDDILPALKPGGYLIYSTCTFNRKENEDVLIKAKHKFGLEPIHYPIPESFNIHQQVTDDILVYRFLPHKVEGEGFVCSVLRKPKYDDASEIKERESIKNKNSLKNITSVKSELLAPWLHHPEDFICVEANQQLVAYPIKHAADMQKLSSKLNVLLAGVTLGQWINQKLIPDTQLAWLHGHSTAIQKIELHWEQAIRYLKKEPFQLDIAGKGFMLVTYKGASLGWINMIQHRFNNYYPTAYRILKSMDELQKIKHENA